MIHVSPGERRPYPTLIGNRYELVRELGRGGFGVVYACNDRVSGQAVALKTFQPKFLNELGDRSNFLREGSIWVNLGRHAHIVHAHRVENFDFGQSVYLVLDLIAGVEGRQDASLSYLLRGAPLTLEQTLRYGLHIARGMRHATTVYPDLVHRDLKPANILVGRDGVARVTDFGLAGLFTDIDRKSLISKDQIAAHVQRGVAGTFLYMPPEQCMAQPLDCRADIYAFGCILYEMLTGQTAIRRERNQTKEDICQAHIRGILNPVPSTIDSSLRSFLVACLSTHVSQRPHTWEDVEGRLTALFPRLLGRQAPVPQSVIDSTRSERITAAWSHKALGSSYFDIGNFDQAERCFQHVLEVGRSEHDTLLQECGYAQLSRVAGARGQHQQALAFADHAYDLARSINDAAGEVAIFSNLGMLYQDLGQPQQAAEIFTRALDIAERLHDQHEQATLLHNLGLALHKLGEWEQALDHFTLFQNITQRMGDRRGECIALGNIGYALNELGDHRAGIAWLQAQISIAEEIGLLGIWMSALGNIGAAYGFLGQPDEALRYHQQHYDYANKLGDHLEELRALNNIAASLCALNQAEQAIEILQEAVQRGQAYDAQASIGVSLLGLSRAYEELAHYDMAVAALEHAANIYTDLEDHMTMMLVCENVKRLRSRINQTAAPLEHHGQEQQEFALYAEKLEAKLRVARAGGNAYTLVDLLQQLGYTYALLGRCQHAITTLNEGATLAQRIHHDQMLLKILDPLGVVYSQTGQFDRAAQTHEHALTLARTNDETYLCNLLINLGVSYRELQQYHRALERLTEGMHYAYANDHDNYYFKSLYHLALTYCDLTDLTHAQIFTNHTVAVARHLNRSAEAAIVVDRLVQLLIAQQHRDEALEYVELSADVHTQAGNTFAAQRAEMLCIALRYVQKHPLKSFGVVK